MQVNVTARHIELTPALREYAEKKLLGIKKYVEKVTNAHVIMNVEKDRHIAEVIVDLSKSRIAATAVAGDMYGAIDLVMDKVIKQVRRQMDKVKEHRDLPYAVVADIVQGQQPAESLDANAQMKEVRHFEARKQSLAEAIKELESRDMNFWLFRSSSDNRINVIYRRSEEGYGMLIVG